MAESAYRATGSFAVYEGGLPRVVREGDLLAPSDPIVKTHRHLLEPMSSHIERTTQAPGEVRPVRLPSGVTAEQAVIPRDTRSRGRSRATTEEAIVPHHLPPEHEDSPASVFAPKQPAAGVVADDADEKGQNLAGGPKASEATLSEAEEKAFLDTPVGMTGEAGTPVVEDEKPAPKSSKK